MKRLSLLVLSLAVVSCGKSSHTQRSPVVIPHFNENAIFLEKEITDCAEKSFDHFNLDFDLNLYLDGYTKTISRNFSGLLDGLYIRDVSRQSIRRSVYGRKQYLLADIDDSGHILGLQENLSMRVEGSSDISVCPTKKSYDPNSIEGAALNASYFIHEVYENVKSAMPDIRIRPINLNIGTIVEIYAFKQLADGLHKAAMYFTDNAYYSPEDVSIDFLPQSKDEKAKGQPTMWNVPMVPAHEYGHHVFNMLAPQNGNSSLGGCFGESSKLHLGNKEIFALDSAREVTNDSVEDALNEGFADLIAYYSLTAEEYSLTGISSLAFNREVSYDYFGIYGDKSFNDRALNAFFSPNHASDDYSSFYQDGHILGAIFAHQADQFMHSLSLNRDGRLELILKWAQDYGNARAGMQNLTPRAYLDRMLQIFIRAAYKMPGRTIDTGQCKEIVKFYPNFSKTFAECSTL